jgi:TRAP-type uncharacterized transport system substrate-binding protein
MRRVFAGIGLMTVLACLSIMPSAHAQDNQTPQECQQGDLCICTGSPVGDYQKAGVEIAKQLGGALGQKVKFINTNGSGDNLNMVAEGKQCQVGLAQSDVYDLWRTEARNGANVAVVQPLYTEYAHILCPSVAEIDNLNGMAKKHATLIIGPSGSGTALTWRSLRDVDGKKYGTDNINVSPDPADSSSVTEVKASTATHPVCLLWISGLNSTPMQNANMKSVNPANGKPMLQLISVDDERMLKLPGFDGPRYTAQEVSPQKNFYDHLINNGGFFTSAGVTVLSVKALLIMNTQFKDQLSNTKRAVYNRFTTAVDDASGVLSRQMSPGAD